MKKVFDLKAKNARFLTELFAGLTTFASMAYLLLAVPQLLAADGGQNAYLGAYTATCLAAFFGTLLMGLLANLPFAAAPSMGLCSFFACSIMAKMDNSFPRALIVVFISSILYILIASCGLRKIIYKSVSKNLRIAVSAGIGLMLAYTGLRSSGIIVAGENGQTALSAIKGIFSYSHTAYVALMTLLCIVIIGIMAHFRLPAYLLLGIVASSIVYWLISLPTGMDTVPAVSFSLPQLGSQFGSWVTGRFGVMFTKGFLELFTSGQTFWEGILSVGSLVLAYTLVNVFDSTGVMLGVGEKGKLFADGGECIELKKGMLSSSISSTVGSVLGVPGTTVCAESGAGVGTGGKTGLTSVVTAICFFAALFLAPFLSFVPTAVSGAALIFIGLMLLSSVKDMDWEDFTEVIPAFLCIIVMPLSGSIADGIYIGVISHALLKLVCLKFENLSILETVLAAIFILKYLFV